MNAMKRISVVFGLLLLLGFVSVSCKENTTDDPIDSIYGEYTFSHASDAFDGLDEDDFHFLCYDAVVNIASDEEHESSLKINCPGEGFSHCFHGSLFENENDSIIYLSDCGDGKNPPNCWDLMANVRREDGKVRLIGSFVFTSGMDGHSFTCYFDVKKD
jgi:hypothetical protein